MKKILVTGGAGFIGTVVTEILSHDDNNLIHIVDDLSSGKNDDDFKKILLRKNIVFKKLDLSDARSYRKLNEEYDDVYHLAAVVGVSRVTKNPVLTLRVNTLSTIYLLDHLRKMKNKPKILFASSCENYAGSVKHCRISFPTPEEIPLCIEDVYNPRWTYACTKILGEMSCIFYAKEYGFDFTVIRYHNVFGPRMGTQHVIPQFILRVMDKPIEFEMHGGDQYRTFCYVTDAAKMTINLMNDPKANGLVVNVGNDHDYIKISSLAKKIFSIMCVKPKLIEKGAPQGSVNRRRPDLSKIKSLGDFVQEVSYDEGLRKTIQWYTNNKIVF